MPKILIIVPSYNEEDNILQLIESLSQHCPNADILVVDDGRDKTADLVKQEQVKHPNLLLLKRESKAGRGSAVVAGLKFGLDKGYDLLVEIDADLSHQPKELPQLLALAGPNNLVIGSRYSKGSKIIGWPLGRRIFSKFANTYANLILGMGIHDYTNGYRVYGREAIKKINLDTIKASGYVVLSEIAYQMFLQGVKFYEVPTVFINRREGVSNFSLKEVREALLSVIRIKREGLK